MLGVVTLPVGTAWAEEEQNSSPNSLQMSPSGVRLTLVAGETLEGHAANCPKTEEGCAIKVSKYRGRRVFVFAFTLPLMLSLVKRMS